MSRLAHQAFFLDDDEKTRVVELLRRVEEFSGVIVLAYAIMSNHLHIFIYVPEPEDIGDEEILRWINALYREASLEQVRGESTRLKDEEAKLLEYPGWDGDFCRVHFSLRDEYPELMDPTKCFPGYGVDDTNIDDYLGQKAMLEDAVEDADGEDLE